MIHSDAILPTTDCCFCREIATGEFPVEYRRAYPVRTRICSDFPDLAVVPSVSPIAAGHLLILSRVHLTRLADMEHSVQCNLLDRVREVTERLGKHFKDPCYFFEHGAANGRNACGVDHAHLHVVPMPHDTIAMIEAKLSIDFPAQHTGSLSDVLGWASVHKNRCYLLHGFAGGSTGICLDDNIPSQYVRRVIADIRGKPECDWKLLDGWNEFMTTQLAMR